MGILVSVCVCVGVLVSVCVCGCISECVRGYVGVIVSVCVGMWVYE